MEKELPKGWIKTKLGEICTKPQYGWTTQSDISGDFKYLRTTDISKGKIDWDRMPFCIDIPEDKEKYLIGINDIVVSRAGSVGLSYRITETPHPTFFASYLIRFKPIIVYPKIVEYYLKSGNYWKAISEMSAGIAVQNVNAVKLSDLDFPLPPLPEQQRIVAKLDTLFGHLDALKTRLERIPQ
ncbi:MAG: restriction endonuclease subunit S, partial [Mariniphaga sp.]